MAGVKSVCGVSLGFGRQISTLQKATKYNTNGFLIGLKFEQAWRLN